MLGQDLTGWITQAVKYKPHNALILDDFIYFNNMLSLMIKLELLDNSVNPDGILLLPRFLKG
jgi:hypothetical protein